MTPPTNGCVMTGEQLIAAAAEEGFEFAERPCGIQWVWGWCRGDDMRWPCYLEERQALNWMRDRLRPGRTFAYRLAVSSPEERPRRRSQPALATRPCRSFSTATGTSCRVPRNA